MGFLCLLHTRHHSQVIILIFCAYTQGKSVVILNPVQTIKIKYFLITGIFISFVGKRHAAVNQCQEVYVKRLPLGFI